ncbi:MAG: PAS domain S-box protein [Desulfobacteraceae bacterium]|nr:PAS domain S-box protein [Desulfobacteraceae bacterium]
MNRKSPIDIIQERIRGFRENTDFVATLFEGLTGYANIAADFDGNIIAYSEEGRKIYGYAPEEVIGKQSIEVLFPKSFSQTGGLQEIINDLHEKEKLSYEGEMIRKNGNTFPAQIVLGLTKNRNGKIVGFVVIAQDLTERKRAEEALMSSETRFRAMIQKNTDGIIIVDQNGITRFVNPAAESLFNRKPEELLGKMFGFPLVVGESVEIDIVCKGGDTVVVEMRSVEIDWEGEKAYLATLRDITEISQSRKRVDLLANLVENASYVMIFMVGPDGQIIECNALAGNTFGYSKSEMPTMNLGALFKFKADERWGKITDSVQQESHWRGELVAMGKDGREFPVDMAVSKSEDKEMESANMICFIRDVSKEKEIDRMKTEFISVASHEMRTPLTSIKNAVDILVKRKAGEITDAQGKFLSMAKRNIDRLAELINNILDISRIESGTMEWNYTEMDIGDCIEHVLDLCKDLADEKSISLKMNIDPNLPATYADVSRIEEVMINLVGNAIKFTPDQGTVTVEVHEVGEVPDMPEGVKGFLNISVIDNGFGIPEEHIDHVFDKFFQVESSLSVQKKSGSGLGLAISRYTIEAHGGTIQCKSKEGEGSTFSFTLPVIDQEQLLYRSLNEELSKARQQQRMFSIVILKLKNFEHFTEAYGNKECEEVLKTIKDTIIKGRVKKTDTILLSPRHGEILLLTPDTDSAGAQIVQKRINQYVGSNEILDGSSSYRPTFISSIATFPENGTSAEELVNRARKRLTIEN